MATRPKHPNKHIESVMRECESRGWTFSKGRKYYRGKCDCGVHMKTIHLTPNGSYLENLKHYFARLDCWNREVTQ